MAFLGFGKKEEKKEEAKDVAPVVKTFPKKVVKKTAEKVVAKTSTSSATVPSVTNYSGILIKPRITEKAAIIAEEGNAYTFNVHPKATKKEIAKAVEDIYKVKPVKVNLVQIKRKTVLRRGKKGKTAGGKKAMIYLKQGDKIEFV